MLKLKEIVEINFFSIICKFTNGEVRKLEIDKILEAKKEDLYVKKILMPVVFNSVKIGELGQLYWDNVAQIKDENGILRPCEYDMSPEFVYYNSQLIFH